MPTPKMHPDELPTSPALVRLLLADQFQRWADLPIEAIPSAGTDNALYRLGEDLVARLPRIGWAAGQPEKETRWLPVLAPRLPLAIPAPLALGEPGLGYPYHWSVCRWLPGENAGIDRLPDPQKAAFDLAGFIRALQGIDPADGPPPDRFNARRGEPFANRDGATREAIAALSADYDSDELAAAWETALAAPPHAGPPVWVHGDLASGNLLAVDGRLSAVIDFGCMAVGDPACDLMPAWSWLPVRLRSAFREALFYDEGAWNRARGWALSTALVALPYYRRTNPSLAAASRRTIRAVLGDFRENG